MKAIILAGYGEKDRHTFQQQKAIFPIRGTPMIQYVIKTLQISEYIDEIIIVGDQKHLGFLLDTEEDLFLLQQKNSMIENIMEAALNFREEDRLLIATCDIPLIHQEVVDRFITEGIGLDAEFCYPIVEKSLCQRYYPDANRTYVKLKEGSFTGGNMVLISSQALKRMERVAALMIKNRKNPLAMCKVLGPKFLIKLLLRQLAVAELESYIEKNFYIKARAIISKDPELASDIDSEKDIQILEKYL